MCLGAELPLFQPGWLGVIPNVPPPTILLPKSLDPIAGHYYHDGFFHVMIQLKPYNGVLIVSFFPGDCCWWWFHSMIQCKFQLRTPLSYRNVGDSNDDSILSSFMDFAETWFHHFLLNLLMFPQVVLAPRWALSMKSWLFHRDPYNGSL